MSFISIEFALFFPLVFLLYWLLRNRDIIWQNVLILIASYIFYACWDFRFLSLIILSTLVDFFVGQGLNSISKTKYRQLLLSLSIFVNLGILAVFKYYNWFIDSFHSIMPGLKHVLGYDTLEIILPVGISFYTFQTMSYTIDVYGNKIKPTKDIIAFSAFVSFFPQLVAGPIERASNLLPQFLSRRKLNYASGVNGLRQILWGLFKKIVIADNSARYANLIFNNSDQYEGMTLVMGAIFFTFQIYGDFSGYSDIAIGSSRLLGFNLQKNFAYPYFSRNFKEFWQRWHISLSTWFRDYLYIPLGGNKLGRFKTLRNIFIVFILSGLWHGAAWSFIVWGVLHAFFLLPSYLHKHSYSLRSRKAGVRDLLAIGTTFMFTVISWIFFRAENLEHALSYISGIFTKSLFLIPQNVFGIEALQLLMIIGLFLFVEWKGREQEFAIEKLSKLRLKPIRFGFYYLIVLAIIWFGAREETFIYFQF
jgi:alginate O-acetyltransferase complex protein AlgI